MSRMRWLLVFLVMSVFLTAAERPKSVMHIVNLRWKDGTTDAQIQKVVAALEDAAKAYPGIRRLWLKPMNIQGGPIGECPSCRPFNFVMVMEFADEAALKGYRDSDAQKKFYEVYLPLRDESRTHDITN